MTDQYAVLKMLGRVADELQSARINAAPICDALNDIADELEASRLQAARIEWIRFIERHGGAGHDFYKWSKKILAREARVQESDGVMTEKE